MKQNEKGQSVFAREIIETGEIICTYNGELCSHSELQKRQTKYNLCWEGSYILEFKFKERWSHTDATKDDYTFGHLINHSKTLQNIKPVSNVKQDKSLINFVALIEKDEEPLYDYSDNSKKMPRYVSMVKKLILLLLHVNF